MISSSSRQFLFDYKVVNSALGNLLISGSDIFIDFSIKRGIRKLPQSFFLVEVLFATLRNCRDQSDPSRSLIILLVPQPMSFTV